MSEDAAGPLRFGPFELDPRTGELRRDGASVRIQEKPSRLLAALLERPGELVTREELRSLLWPADTFVDFEGGLNTAVNKVRSALGDSADAPRFVETVGRRGYRFIGPVEVPSVSSVAETQRPAAQPLRRGRKWLAAVGLILAATLGVLGWRGLRQRAPQIESIAVLPLESLSSDPEHEYFAEGMTDAVITGLATSMHTVRVTSRQSVLRYREALKPLPEIARELDVDAVVEGTVLRSGERVRITAQLIDSRGDRHLWAGSYERDLRDVLALQDELARSIAREIRVVVSPAAAGGPERVARTVDPQVYEAYLRGRYLWNRISEENLNKALAAFQEAVDKDPEFALGWVGIADCYARLGWYGHTSGRSAGAGMKEAILKALALDETLAEAHSALGTFAGANREWALAERELRRAIELNPSDATARLRLGLIYEILGRQEENLDERRRAAQIDPLNQVVSIALAEALLYSGKTDAAAAQIDRTLELDPDFQYAYRVRGHIYEAQGRCDEAIAAYTKAQARAETGYALAACGRLDEARTVLAELEAGAAANAVSAADVAMVQAGLGNKAEAMTWLEKAYEEGNPALPHVRVEPQFAALRTEPGFQRLLERMNLPPAASSLR